MYVLEIACGVLSVLAIVMLFVVIGTMVGTGPQSKATAIMTLIGFPIWLLQLAVFTIVTLMKG
jgi:hypothetical protein